MSRPTCPECISGKHQNCVGQALDEQSDAIVDCECTTCYTGPAEDGWTGQGLYLGPTP